MVSRSKIASILEDYMGITIATVCSHSPLQIFQGARLEGFQPLGRPVGKQPKFYDAFPLGKPDEFLVVESYKDIPEHVDDLIAKSVVTVPHGSFVEYMGADTFPLGKPDEFLVVESYKDIPEHVDDLIAKSVVTVPHGSFVEYMGADTFAKMEVPTFGNREVLKWETDRGKQRRGHPAPGV